MTYRISSGELESELVSVSKDKGPFVRLFIRGLGCGPPRFQSFEPGELHAFYPIRILFLQFIVGPDGEYIDEDLKDSGRLAFPEPGTYSIKIDFPFHLKGSKTGNLLESNIVEVRIEEPDGVDAEVWNQIRGDDVLRFLQSGGVPRGREDILLKVADLVQKYPETRYREALRHALRRSLGSENQLPQEDRTRIRALLGITEEMNRFYVLDDRLDGEVVLHAPEVTTLDQVLASLSRQSRVPLKASKSVGRDRLWAARRVADLRSLMQELAEGASAGWRGSGEGYVLIRTKELLDEAREDARRMREAEAK
ncbi:MAG: hypothetical protein WKF75_01535, partial [Singulisphaera sp.]